MVTSKNLVLNAAGLGLPLLAGLFAIPVLITELGLARFGVLSLFLAGLAWLQLLDLGIGSAVTYTLSKPGTESQAPDSRSVELVRSAFTFATILGLCVCMLLWTAAPYVQVLMESSPPGLIQETEAGLRAFAVAAPAVLVHSLVIGVLSAGGRFGAINAVRIPFGVLTFVGPTAVVVWTDSLTAACMVISVIRIGWTLIHLWQCRAFVFAAGKPALLLSIPVVRSMLAFGGWITVSNIAGSLMVYADRFALGIIHSAEEVARFSLPFELATKLWLIPALAVPVLFPMFVREFWGRPRGQEGDQELPLLAAAWTAIVCAIPASLMAAYSPAIVAFLSGHHLQADSIAVLRVLAGAVLVNCVAQIYLVQVQSTGRTHLIARVHCAEVLFYLVALWWFVEWWGILGAAAVWAIRVLIDAMIFCGLAAGSAPARQRAAFAGILFVTILYGVGLANFALMDAMPAQLLLMVLPALAAWQLRQKFPMRSAPIRPPRMAELRE